MGLGTRAFAASAEPAHPAPAELEMPEVFVTPTAWLLPPAVVHSRLAVDTGKGASGDLRVGLGHVAEIGIGSLDNVRVREHANGPVLRLLPYMAVGFRIGVAERRFHQAMPAVAIGFRKSFEHEYAGRQTRVADFSVTASKRFSPRFAASIGGVLWDATSTERSGDMVALHELGVKHQLRAFGSIELRPLPDSTLVVDLGWTPELCLDGSRDPLLYRSASGGSDECSRAPIRIVPVLAWGVRYDVAPWLQLESGVRIPDVQHATVRDAQIFAQLRWSSRALRTAIDNLP